jgi:hypothetical protein
LGDNFDDLIGWLPRLCRLLKLTQKVFGEGFIVDNPCILIDGNKQEEFKGYASFNSLSIDIVFMLRLTGNRKIHIQGMNDAIYINGITMFDGRIKYACGDNSDSEGHNAVLYWVMTSKRYNNIKNFENIPSPMKKVEPNNEIIPHSVEKTVKKVKFDEIIETPLTEENQSRINTNVPGFTGVKRNLEHAFDTNNY